jgi:hypothetical protein
MAGTRTTIIATQPAVMSSGGLVIITWIKATDVKNIKKPITIRIQPNILLNVLRMPTFYLACTFKFYVRIC